MLKIERKNGGKCQDVGVVGGDERDATANRIGTHIVRRASSTPILSGRQISEAC